MIALDPVTLTWLTALAFAYAAILHSLQLRGAGRALGPGRRIAFAAGLAAAAAALLSPVESLAETSLVAHMAQHMLMIALAAPLLAFGAPPLRLLAGLPGRLRRTFNRARRRLGTAPGGPVALAVILVAVHAAAVWIWHVPAVYELAVTSTALHLLEHFLFLATAVTAWWAILEFGGRIRPSAGMVIVLLGLAAQGAMLGALMAFAGQPWYPLYEEQALRSGRDPLAEQQLAGMIMWGAGGIVPFLAGVAMVIGWFGYAERHPAAAGPALAEQDAGIGVDVADRVEAVDVDHDRRVGL